MLSLRLRIALRSGCVYWNSSNTALAAAATSAARRLSHTAAAAAAANRTATQRNANCCCTSLYQQQNGTAALPVSTPWRGAANCRHPPRPSISSRTSYASTNAFTRTAATTAQPATPAATAHTTDGPASSLTNQPLIGEAFDFSLALSDARVGQTLDIPYELTASDYWREHWQSSFIQLDRLYTSAPFAARMNLHDVVLPFTLMLFKASSMSHISDEIEVLDLGFENAVYCRAAFAGDTFRKHFHIKGLRGTSDGQNTIVRVHCALFNGADQLCFSVDKVMLYQKVPLPGRVSKAPSASAAGMAAGEHESSTDDAKRDVFRRHIVRHADVLPYSTTLAPLRAGQLLLHSTVKPIGKSTTMALSTMLRFTHPLLTNLARYPKEELVVPGQLVLASACASASRDFYEVLHEEIMSCRFLNKCGPEDAIGAISYVHSLERTPESEGGLEEVTVTTLGIKNVDVTRTLRDVRIPRALFDISGKSEEGKSRNIEALLKKECTELVGKVVVRATRKLLRQSVYGQPKQMPLL